MKEKKCFFRSRRQVKLRTEIYLTLQPSSTDCDEKLAKSSQQEQACNQDNESHKSIDGNQATDKTGHIKLSQV